MVRILMVLFFVSALSAAADTKALQKEYVNLAVEQIEIIESVKDKSSAQRAAKKIDALLGKQKKFAGKLKKEKVKFQELVSKAAENPKYKKTLESLFPRMMKAGQSMKGNKEVAKIMEPAMQKLMTQSPLK